MRISPVDILRQLRAEGVSPVLLVSDNPDQYQRSDLPPDVSVHRRDELDALQRSLRSRSGVSALVYEQTCAAEKRRRRKRGTLVEADKRVFINPEVCEGCGDCAVQSNCVSVQPLETALGRKRQIDQSACNKDYSCTKGFCPSFVTVTGARIAARVPREAAQLDAAIAALPPPRPAPLATDGYNVLVAGIGGTGVLTVGALLGMAAHLDGLACSVLDTTGMAQKGGAVTSHIRINRAPELVYSSRLSLGSTDLVIGCDMVVTSSADVLKTVQPGHSTIVVNEDVTPTGDFQNNQDLDTGEAAMLDVIRRAVDGGPMRLLHATHLSTELTGDSIGTNILMLGFAAQLGVLPVSIGSLEEAIRLNGTFVKGNLRTFAIGRVAAHDPGVLTTLFPPEPADLIPDTPDAIIAHRRALLESYQDSRYAERFSEFIARVRERIESTGVSGTDTLVGAIAHNLARLMAYKDEYEVARLYTDRRFWERLRKQFEGDYEVTFHLAPPVLPGLDDSGRPRKRAFGKWMIPLFRLLARLRRLRGTPFDLFGLTAERKMERALIEEYRSLIDRLVSTIDRSNLDLAVLIASAANDVRGYGPVKLASVERYRSRIATLLLKWNAPTSRPTASRGTVPAIERIPD
jgi:indolepyruvate ferredoxin oxidoreductase